MLRLLDTLVHRLSWVVPYALYRFICDRYEARLLTPVDDWADDPAVGLDEVERRLVELEPVQVVTPIGYRCQHAGIVVGAGVTLSDASAWCGCQMEPVYAASPWASNSAGVATTPTWRPFDTNGAA